MSEDMDRKRLPREVEKKTHQTERQPEMKREPQARRSEREEPRRLAGRPRNLLESGS